MGLGLRFGIGFGLESRLGFGLGLGWGFGNTHFTLRGIGLEFGGV